MTISIQRALTELNRKNVGSGKPELKTRIGLDTGPAVVDATGEIYGDVANVAARVQAQAEPGATRANGRRLATFSLRSTDGSLKGLIRAI